MMPFGLYKALVIILYIFYFSSSYLVFNLDDNPSNLNILL